ncbi:MAG: hypothetical protein RMJ57_05290, partial [Bacteroidia bacterium]|nr:hypothetical protein [Bacteroidia bacterium]
LFDARFWGGGGLMAVVFRVSLWELWGWRQPPPHFFTLKTSLIALLLSQRKRELTSYEDLEQAPMTLLPHRIER